MAGLDETAKEQQVPAAPRVDDPPAYDCRGVLLPPRARVGGIITPQ